MKTEKPALWRTLLLKRLLATTPDKRRSFYITSDKNRKAGLSPACLLKRLWAPSADTCTQIITWLADFVKREGAESGGIEPHPPLGGPFRYQLTVCPAHFTLRYPSASPHVPDTTARYEQNSSIKWHNIP